VAIPGPIAQPSDLPKLSAEWERLRADHTLRGREWSRAAKEVTGSWLRDVFEWAVGAGEERQGQGAGRAPRRSGPLGALRGRRAGPDSEEPAKGLALLAVGSLGRGDLAPGSDLDLLLVHDGRRDVSAVADRLWYPIWDDPMPLDHSVRTRPQVVQAAESDLRVALGLLDARAVAGDPELAADVVARGRRLWDKRVGKWLPAVLESRAASQLAHGDVAFLLEPELQEGRGGLRDLQVLALLATVTPVAATVVADKGLVHAGDLLHAVRVELQRPTGRRSERLMLEDQDRVAEALGLASREALAHDVAEAGRTVAWLLEDASRRAQSWLAGPRGRAGSADRSLGPGLVLRDNEVTVPAATVVGADASLALRAAEASAELGVPLSRATMERLAKEAPRPAAPWPEDVRRAFLKLLGAGPSSIHAIETLDHLGVWERYLTEWPRVRNRPQFDPYHRWTVDRHLLEAAANAAAYTLDVRRPDMLLLGTLLHDIGKGTGADHSEAGAAIAEPIAARLGLSAEDSHMLDKLVRHHLLLPDIATRRDLDDPATVASVAGVVGDVTTLELLGAMARADGEATGSAAWTPWKARLVDDLVQRVTALLEGRPVPTGPPFPSPEHRRLMAAGGLQVIPSRHEIVVVAPDRPGLFSDVTGALALHGIGVLEARAHSENGQALEVLVLDLPEHADPRWDRVVAGITGAVERRFNMAEALARRPPPRSMRRAHLLPAPGVRVIVDNDAATSATVVEVRAPDAPGVLHQITAAIAGLDLDIVSARVATLGNAVIDTFYVRAEGAKLARQADTERVRNALQGTLERTLGAGKP
jgi:[protein-PII] uridylyltransferase